VQVGILAGTSFVILQI